MESKDTPAKHETDAPLISVALLIKNGMPELKDLLASLRSQRGCPEMEIVAVDSGSSDGSLQVMRDAGVRVTQVPPESFRFGTMRQMAFSQTRGKVILTMSQDAMPGGDDWLAAMTGPILAGELDIVQASEQAPQSEQIKLAILNCAHTYRHWTPPYSEISCAGLAISRDAWLQTGFGDVQMSEDHYLGMLARAKKMRMARCDSVPMLHGHSYTLMSHIKRSFNEGMGARSTDGKYSLSYMIGDIFFSGRIRMAASAVIKHRSLGWFEALWFPLRPVFLYLGWRFGKKYWR